MQEAMRTSGCSTRVAKAVGTRRIVAGTDPWHAFPDSKAPAGAGEKAVALMRGLLTTLPVAILLMGALPGPAHAAPVHNCGRATVAMPSPEAHRAWLAKDVRYGPDDAAAFAGKVKRFGPHVLEYQVIVAEVMSASAWFDLEGHGGLREAKVRMIKKPSCEQDKYYPLVALVGMKARSIERNALLVAKSPGAYEVISIKGHPEGKPYALRLAGSREVLCKDIRDCEGLATHPRFRR
jgi:hypothetical protein